MAFDEVLLPLAVGYGTTGGPAFSTEIVIVDSGYERRNQNWAEARRIYDARTGVRSSSDAAALLSFFHARAGRARGFRLSDPMDYSSAADGRSAPSFADQNIGTGDGATTQFQLIKNYVSGSVTHRRTIQKPVASSTAIGINGVQQNSGWSIDTTTGIITFATAPTTGQTITAGFMFDVPVRFDTDQLALTLQDHTLTDAAIRVVEIKV